MKYFLLVCSLLLSITVFAQPVQSPRKVNDSTFITSDGVRLYVSQKGKGSACIFLHGGPGAWSKSFQELGGNRVASAMHVYFFDQRGCGRSQNAPDSNYSMTRMVQDIEDIRLLTGAQKVYLMAHSFGGVLACRYAQLYPQHVKGLILVDVTLDVTRSLRSQIRYTNQLTGSHIPDNEADCMPSFIKAVTLMRSKGLSYKFLTDSKASMARLDSIDATNPGSFAFGRVALGIKDYMADFTAASATIKAPVLVIAGLKDHAVGADHYKLFRFPYQQTVLINGGHMLYYENNAGFVQAVTRFVQQTDRQGR